uniref:C2H2-type domain-containing protein n=1 Tax=Leptobrachium leishanense TaxID=445787 RepID=A0A8C5M931_9ANUR
MNPDTARDPLSQRILDLTLEMIFLLTGEAHMVVKIHEMVSDSSLHQISEGHGRSQSFNTEPPPHSGIHEQNHEKILELANKITRLLTGKVPIRCEDVTVYLSMEEWEYVERHKELYEDVMMEDHQPVITLDKPVSGELHCPVSSSDCGTEILTKNEEKYLNKTTNGRAESAKYTERECPLPVTNGPVPEERIYPTTECTEYKPSDMKEESDSCEGENPTDGCICKPTENTQIESTSAYTGRESESHGEGDISHPDISPLPEHTQTEYPSTDIKEESPTYGEGNLTDSDMYEPPEHTQTRYPTENTLSIKINHSESLIESRKPDQSIYYTDLLTHNSVYEKCSALSSEKGKVSYSESDLVIYERNGKEPFFPAVCGGNFTSESALKHQDVHTEGQTFSCPEYRKCFIDSVALNKGQRIHTGIKQFQCTECGKCYSSASSLRIHERIHTEENPLTCLECRKCFSRASNLARHTLIHTGDKPFKCKECGRCFTQASTLAVHRRVHTGEKPFECPACGKCFTHSLSLVLHKRIHTGEKPFKCPECCKCFANTSNLARHTLIHTGEKPFKCKECGRCFTQASTLAVHGRVHTGEKPFECPACGKCFTHSLSLVLHKRIHTGEKPFKCQECEKCFNRASHLARHTLIHTGEKPFKCKECGKCFTQASTLAVHRRVHTGEKPFECPACGKCFSHVSSLALHKVIHTGVKLFK